MDGIHPVRKRVHNAAVAVGLEHLDDHNVVAIAPLCLALLRHNVQRVLTKGLECVYGINSYRRVAFKRCKSRLRTEIILRQFYA